MSPRSGRAASACVGALLDATSLLVFAAVGRRSHDEVSGPVGVALTAWPFLAAAALGWVLAFAFRRRPPVDVRGGLVVWLATVVGGIVLRALTGAGTAASFVVVASLVTAALLLGWRAFAQLGRRRGAPVVL